MGPHSPPRRDAGIDGAIARLASRQHGLVTRVQLTALRLGPEAIKWRIRNGRLHRIHRSVYAVGHAALTESGRELAAVLACGPSAALSHCWAATKWGMPIPRRPRKPEVLVSGARAPRHPGIQAYRCAVMLPRDVHRLDRISVTSPARTIRDLATALDGARLERVVAAALDRHLVRRAQLIDQLERYRGARGIGTLRRILEARRMPARTASDAEVELLRALRDAGLPEPEVNARIGGHKVDYLWRVARLIVEFDSFAFHSDRAAFEADRLRDAQLGDLGFRVIRVTWRQLRDQRDQVIARILRALATRLSVARSE